MSIDVGLLHFYDEFFRLCNHAIVSESQSHPKTRLWIADCVAPFCIQSGQNSHLSLTLARYGLTGDATAQSVRLYIVASGKRFPQNLQVFQPVYDEQERLRAILKT